jgi:hypothetical protein
MFSAIWCQGGFLGDEVARLGYSVLLNGAFFFLFSARDYRLS